MNNRIVRCAFNGNCAYAEDLINDKKSTTLQESEMIDTFNKIFDDVRNCKLNSFKVSKELNNILHEKGLFS
jgi:hypothetical protein